MRVVEHTQWWLVQLEQLVQAEMPGQVEVHGLQHWVRWLLQVVRVDLGLQQLMLEQQEEQVEQLVLWEMLSSRVEMEQQVSEVLVVRQEELGVEVEHQIVEWAVMLLWQLVEQPQVVLAVAVELGVVRLGQLGRLVL
mgnify:CR=1 FL=1